jgi:hypothetical protein
MLLAAPFFWIEVRDMERKNVIRQSPRPEVVMYSPEGKEKLRFDTSHRTILQGYTFETAIYDARGKFSLTFYPDDTMSAYEHEAIFDHIQVMDIVEIYESRNHFQQYRVDLGLTLIQKILPTFTGVIREKKFSAQATDSGVNRRIMVSGHSIAGLVQEFRVNIDMQATALTGELANNQQLDKEFTIKFIQNNNEPLEVGYVIQEIWKSFINLSSQYGRATNPKVAHYIKKWMGDDFFTFDGSVFHYPLASIFRGQSTQNFYDVVDGILSAPVYEKFAYTERDSGKAKIMIRETPFDSESWKKLTCMEIEPVLVKSFDLSQSDKEVYTVFFSYLTGYPLQDDKMIILASQGVKDVPGVVIDSEKFGCYGYRPLFVHFNGYGKADGKEDTGTGGRLQKLNERLHQWYGNLDKMFSGNITMETDLAQDMPQAGERVSFLNGEFYVIGAEHRWTYGGNPETSISLGRGGDYAGGGFTELKDTAQRYKEFKELV